MSEKPGKVFTAIIEKLVKREDLSVDEAMTAVELIATGKQDPTEVYIKSNINIINKQLTPVSVKSNEKHKMCFR